MSWTLEKFAAACQQALNAEPGPAGRKKVCEICLLYTSPSPRD